MCLFEYDEKREKELIRKAEFQEGVKDATKQMIQALQLIQKKCSPNEIEQETDLSPETVEKMLETLHVNSYSVFISFMIWHAIRDGRGFSPLNCLLLIHTLFPSAHPRHHNQKTEKWLSAIHQHKTFRQQYQYRRALCLITSTNFPDTIPHLSFGESLPAPVQYLPYK